MPIPQHDSFRFGSTEITYTVRRSKERKTIGITLCGPMVEVTAPAGMWLNVIQSYVEKKAEWIAQKLDLARHHKPIYPTALHSGVAIRLFGRQYICAFCQRMQSTPACPFTRANSNFACRRVPERKLAND